MPSCFKCGKSVDSYTQLKPIAHQCQLVIVACLDCLPPVCHCSVLPANAIPLDHGNTPESKLPAAEEKNE